MAQLRLDFYDNRLDHVYSDGDIEEELLQISIAGNEYDWYEDGRWPIVYHLSPWRENILNWYPFESQSTILEVGAGCGALTGLLCQRAKKVVSIELSRRRAEINYNRHKGLDNLEIFVCDIQKIPSEWKFDYIIVNGVLEYASYMFEDENPYKTFMEHLRNNLSANGRILLSIENRLGLKYFAGAKEDHNGKYFSGLNGYVNHENERTFTKFELTELMSESKLHILKFFYPYPDYKFPFEIFTDSTINERVPSTTQYPLDLDRLCLFHERSVQQSLMKMNTMDRFSNSFLIEISHDSNLNPSNISYVKSSTNRKDEFQIITAIDEKMEFAKKAAANGRSLKHLRQMEAYNHYQFNKNITNISCQSLSDSLAFPIVREPSLLNVLESCQKKRDQNGFLVELKKYIEVFYQETEKIWKYNSPEFRALVGDEECSEKLRWKANANIDMVASNIFVAGGSNYLTIDYEWQMPFEIPLEYPCWRMLKQLSSDHGFHSYLNRDAIIGLADITDEVERCFTKWEAHFAENYVGIRPTYKLSKKITSLDLEKAVQREEKETMIVSTAFFNLGNGFSDQWMQNKVAESQLHEGFKVTFTGGLLNKAKEIRWDPLEGFASRIKINRIECDAINLQVYPLNSENNEAGQFFTFYSYDPQFLLTGDFSACSYLSIEYSCIILDWTTGYQQREIDIAHLNDKLSELSALNHVHKNQLEDYNHQKNQLENQLVEMDSQIEFLHAEVKSLEEQLAESNQKIEEMNNEIETIFAFTNTRKLTAMKNILLHGMVVKGGKHE